MFSFVNMEKLLEEFRTKQAYLPIKWKAASGRYITLADLKKIKSKFDRFYQFKGIGESVEERKIYQIKIGSGPIKVLAWSQMHGNESTTTKAIFDLIAFFNHYKDHEEIKKLLQQITLVCIPILNPDGAKYYTRVNANHVDLNRDMQRLSQPESSILRKLAKEFQPDYCLNLHDQRTIFSVGPTNNPAVLSFLTPARDEERTIDKTREESMALIATIADYLKPELENKIGRYDDGFNINCAGDTFQSAGIPTILFEAGHFPGDYQREETRRYIFLALISGLAAIANDNTVDFQKYFDLPENQKLFRDVIIRNVDFEGSLVDVVIQFKETLKNGKLRFVPIIEKIGQSIQEIGHREIDAQNEKIRIAGEELLIENVVVNKIFLKSTEIPIKME
ncbi:MAG: peptidase M14 [Gramella sp.]|nr:peptidase M14 [Christiangramia sp.]